MYQGYFGLTSAPFSIVPDHRVVYMSASHKEAVAHLLYSLKQSGGFVQLTGEVGTGKTTVSRYLLQHLPEDVDVALLLNPRINEQEMLETICDELKIAYPAHSTQKGLIGALNLYLLQSHTNGRHTVLIIDEAQNLSREVLEQVRLLTNLETSTDKLLQIILIGQPELENILGRHDLRQLSQRIIGRFRLEPLNLRETREYITYRLKQAGCERRLFTHWATRRIHSLSGGVPRVINVLCDSALMGAYSQNSDKVNWGIVGKVAKDVLPPGEKRGGFGRLLRLSIIPLVILGAGAALIRSEKPDYVVEFLAKVLPGSPKETAITLDDSSDQASGTETGQSTTDLLLSEVDNSEQTAESGIKEVDQAARMTQPQTPNINVEMQSRFDLVYRLGVPLKRN